MADMFDDTGSGTAIVFLHAGIGDRRMWHPQWNRFAQTNRLVRIDLCGFGTNPPRKEPFSNRTDVIEILDELDIETAAVVGASMGARVAVEVAIDSPERVSALMLVGAGMPDHEWSQTTQNFWQVEADAFDAGDLTGAVEAVLSFWVDGPKRTRSQLTSADRELVASMQRLAFEHELAHPDAAAEVMVPDLGDRLSEIAVPTRVLYGAEDVADIMAIAERLAAVIPNATLHCIDDTAHLPSLETPDIVNAHLAALLEL